MYSKNYINKINNNINNNGMNANRVKAGPPAHRQVGNYCHVASSDKSNYIITCKKVYFVDI